jgi:hypothetical protein
VHQTQYLKPVDSQQYYIIILLLCKHHVNSLPQSFRSVSPDLISTDEDPGLQVESFAVTNSHGVSTNKSIICFIIMQTYKELNIILTTLVAMCPDAPHYIILLSKPDIFILQGESAVT